MLRWRDMRLFERYGWINLRVDFTKVRQDKMKGKSRKLYYVSRLDAFLTEDAHARQHEEKVLPLYFVRNK